MINNINISERVALNSKINIIKVGNVHTEDIILRLNLSEFNSIGHMRISVKEYLSKSIVEHILCDNVNCSLSAHLTKGTDYEIYIHLEDYIKNESPCEMSVMMNLTLNPLEYLYNLLSDVDNLFNYDSIERLNKNSDNILKLEETRQS